MSCGPDCQTGCECCRGTTELTPDPHGNRPRLSALAWRVGTHGSFHRTMLAGISRRKVLRPLTTREERDPTIALLDAWAVTLDVLTFYQERIANEGFLRTATERRSVIELARTLGYEANPGVAASTFLAFTLDGSPGSPREVAIPTGTKVQSLPTKHELPQTFETDEDLLARPEWNLLVPRQQGAQTIKAGTSEIVLQGTGLALRPGDLLLLWQGADTWEMRRVRKADPATETTRIALDQPVEKVATQDPSQIQVFALRQPAALFGHNAPDWRAMPDKIKDAFGGASLPDWLGFAIKNAAEIDLDAVYPQLVAGGRVVLKNGTTETLFTIVSVETVSRADYTLAAKVGRLTLDAVPDATAFGLRETSVFAGSDPLELAQVALTTAVEGQVIELDRPVPGLERGRRLLFKNGGVTEVAVIEGSDAAGTSLTLREPLRGSYPRSTVQIFANLAPASHGETQREVLGSGDGARPFQRFRLRQMPLTYRAAAVPSGGESTLTLRVDGVRWHQTPDLLRLGKEDRAFTLRHDAAGTATVTFGDGRHGARLPSGVENVEAVYRKGIGREGLVEEDRLALLLTRPLGVKSVTNPAPATGGEDPEPLGEARRNAPTTVLTLDRVVSLTDYEDFSRSFAGIGKAQARLVWRGGERRIHLSVAASDGTAIPADSALFGNLREALERFRDRQSPLTLASVAVVRFYTQLKVKVDPDYRQEDVFPRVEDELRRRFSPAARDFGQGVAVSELAAVAQGVAGVVAVDLDYLDLQPSGLLSAQRRISSPAVPQPRPRLFAQPARLGPQGQLLPAEILALSPQSPTLGPMP